jgi:hypothetical protein
MFLQRNLPVHPCYQTDFTLPQIAHLKEAAHAELKLVFSSYTSGAGNESSSEEEEVANVPPLIVLENIPLHLRAMYQIPASVTTQTRSVSREVELNLEAELQWYESNVTQLPTGEKEGYNPEYHMKHFNPIIPSPTCSKM